MLKILSRWLFHSVWGWKVKGNLPDAKKYLIVVAPHTSNWDFFVAVLFRKITDGFNPKYMAKKELFVFPIGYFFRWAGGVPVERSKSTNFVDSIVSIYDSHDTFATTITPEGTRGYNSKWKSGFYHIAKNANIPILRIAFDFGTMTFVIDDLYHINKGVEDTIIEFKEYFSQYTGKNAKDGVKWPE